MHIPSHSVHTAAHYNPLQPKAKHPVHIQCTHCSSHYIFSAHTAATITSSVHTLQQPLYLQCTLQPCTAMYSYLKSIFSAHCSHVYPCTAICSQSSVHTAAIYNHLHCSYSIQCTLQLYYPVHTAAILYSTHCSYTIQCTLQLYYPVHTTAILSSAHCSYSIQCTLQIYYLVHTAAILSSAHCSYTIYTVHPVHL